MRLVRAGWAGGGFALGLLATLLVGRFRPDPVAGASQVRGDERGEGVTTAPGHRSPRSLPLFTTGPSPAPQPAAVKDLVSVGDVLDRPHGAELVRFLRAARNERLEQECLRRLPADSEGVKGKLLISAEASEQSFRIVEVKHLEGDGGEVTDCLLANGAWPVTGSSAPGLPGDHAQRFSFLWPYRFAGPGIRRF